MTSLSISWKRARIEQKIDPLAGGELTRLVLPLQPIVAAAGLGAPFEIFEVFDWIHAT